MGQERPVDARQDDFVFDQRVPLHYSFETINPYGTMVFDIAGVLKRSRRPLRRP